MGKSAILFAREEATHVENAKVAAMDNESVVRVSNLLPVRRGR
jgi:hypothetical protein